MLATIIGIFLIAALLGMVLISYVLKNKNTPKGLAFTHGPLAALGLVLLIIYAFTYGLVPIESIVLFIIAALGGFVMIYRDLTGKTLPKWLAIVHGSVAIIAFIFLIVFAIQKAL